MVDCPRHCLPEATRTTIAAALPEVWEAFSAQAEQQHGAEDRRMELDAQLRDMLARLSNAGKALSVQKERKLGRGSADVQGRRMSSGAGWHRRARRGGCSCQEAGRREARASH